MQSFSELTAQYGILAILVLSLGSFFAGAIPDFSSARLTANLDPEYLGNGGFFAMFALFFPAVTGIMAGVNMSGDLKSPSKSIPSGTLAAIAVTAVVYLLMAVVFAGSRPRGALQLNPFVILDISASPALINAGIFAATLSSALGSMMGAPRILQALSRDDIFPRLRYFARGAGASNEPRRATVVTFFIAQLGILLGDLNAIAPIITMFFMVTYGTINLACFYESWTRNPSYRPSFRLSHWSAALLGTVGCAGVMILMEPLWAVAAILAMAGLHWSIRRMEVRAAWGDVRSGVAFQQARKALLRLEDKYYHPKNWRPILLGLSGGAWQRNHLAEFGGWLTAGRGVITLAQVMVGEVEELMEKRQTEEDRLRKYIEAEELQAFAAVVVDHNLLQGIKALLQCTGIGGVRPNTVLLGWSEDAGQRRMFCRILRVVRGMERSLLVVYYPDTEKRVFSAPTGTIDLWWKGGRNGALMLLLAHLLTQNPAWRNHSVRLLVTVANDAAAARAAEAIATLLEAARVTATPMILVASDSRAEMGKVSQESALVMIGFEPPPEDEEEEAMAELRAGMEGLRHVLLVSSAGGHSLSA